MELNNSAIFLLVVNVLSAGLILITVYLLRSKHPQRFIQTYSSSKTKSEDGPILKLPKGVITSGLVQADEPEERKYRRS